MPDLLSLLRQARAIDLAQPWLVGMPHWPTHPPFAYSLTKAHGDYLLDGEVSSAADSMALGTHTGTHIDALCHFSCRGLLHGGVEAATAQSYGKGLRHETIDMVAPIVRRGVLLDIAALHAADVLPENHEITPGEMGEAARRAGVEVEPGDVVLLRTGWGRLWHDPRRFMNETRQPGPRLDGARWLSQAGVFAAGSDTAAFELVPSPRMEVHVHLLVESGIHILECLNLEELAALRPAAFAFVAAPLKIVGATGSPLRPFALAG
jgi:kynurenine formamidase